jgi:seryl-tRNA(Sec) selenium transferase
VDAAAELPAKPNPYLARGADLVAYSGGKILRDRNAPESWLAAAT